MKTPNTIWLGILTLLPALSFFVFIAYIISAMIMASNEVELPAWTFIVFFSIFIIGLFLQMLLTVLFILKFVSKAEMSQSEKVTWIVIVAAVGFVGLPMYWYQYIWKVRKIE